MKNIYKGLVFVSSMFVFSSMNAVAQVGMNIIAEQDSSDYKVQLPFRTVQQEDLLGGVSVIDMNEINSKAYTTYSLDMLNNAIGGASNGIWGISDYLVIVDGMVRDANNVLPHEIEQITVLKGAAAVVLYGSRAAKGVVQITTKRGQAGDLNIKVTANTGFYVPKVLPTYLSSAEYMSYYNQAYLNDGNTTPRYSDEEIYNYASGKNPYRYANLNMYDSEYLRKAYNRSEAIAEVTGGNERVKFYSTLGYYREAALLKVGNHKDDYISRFFVRGNVDMKLHELINVRTDANVTFYDSYTAKGDWWSKAATLRPNRIAPLIPLSYIEANDQNTLSTIMNSNYIIDGKYFLGATQEDTTNPVADAYAAGDSKFVSRQFQFNTHFDVNLRPLLEGLFFRAQYGIDYASTYNQGYNNNYATFAPTWNTYSGKDMITSVVQYGKDQKSGNEDISNSAYRYTYNMSFQFDYQKTIAEQHNVFGMLVANAWQTQQNGQYHHKTNVNLGAQLSYNYNHKYYIDFSAALPYSAKLPEGNRAGFSPTLTLGWRPTQETFWNNSIFDDLMITASAGIIMQDIDITDGNGNDYYLYKMILQTGGWYSWGDLGGSASTEFQRGDNFDMTFVKRKEISVGLRGSMLNQALSFDFNFFKNKMDGMLARPSSLYPIYFTQTGYPTSSIIPFVNYNIDNRIGFDFALTGRQTIGQVEAQLGVTGMYYDGTVGKRDENYAYAYQSRVGHSLNGIWGLKSDGLFQNQEEIDNAPNQTFGTVKPGDIKYIDRNGDNVIDNNDEYYLGRWDDAFTMGINLTLKWKDFTFFAMGNAGFGGMGMKDNSYYWVRGEDKYSDIVRNAWTPENPNATYPRLTTTSGDNNFRYSDFWTYKRDRFELRQVQLSYTMPQSVLKGSFVKGLELFASGYNLLTIAKERKAIEMNVGSAPQTRFFNIGFKGTF